MRHDTVRQPRYELIGAGILFLLVTAYFAYAMLWSQVKQTIASRSFQPVAATVVSAAVAARGSDRTTHGAAYSPRIVYRYSLNGREYEGERYFFTGQSWRDHAAAQSVVERYAAGSVVRAYVNPSDPGEAVLDASAPGWGMMLGWLLPLALFGLFVTGAGVRGRARR